MQLTNESKKFTLLAVLAHPDDESFGIGGTLAYYSRHGVHVELVCATKGEVGEMDQEFQQENMTSADIRVNELRCAAAILGISKIHFLEYRDSGMAGSIENQHPQALCNQPVEQVAAQVAEIIRNVQPDIVITFDPIGGYRHPDHIAIHHATVLAYQLAGDASVQLSQLPAFRCSKLIYSTFPKGMMRWMIRLMKLAGKDPSRFGKNQDIDLTSIASETFPIHYRINYSSVTMERDAAAICHASQGGSGLSSGLLGFFRKIITPYETFMQAEPEFTSNHAQDDLFSGLNGN